MRMRIAEGAGLFAALYYLGGSPFKWALAVSA